MLTATPSALVPQFLMVYSPRFNAQTIRAHVESLRTKGFVWWGRFSAMVRASTSVRPAPVGRMWRSLPTRARRPAKRRSSS